MPFPPTLVETLAHTASFVDRAGYLAKYAVDVCASPESKPLKATVLLTSFAHRSDTIP